MALSRSCIVQASSANDEMQIASADEAAAAEAADLATTSADDVTPETSDREQFSTDENKERGNWSGRLDFVLELLGYDPSRPSTIVALRRKSPVKGASTAELSAGWVHHFGS